MKNRSLTLRLTLMAAVAALIPLLAFLQQGYRTVDQGLTAIHQAQSHENDIAVQEAHLSALARLEGAVDFHLIRAQTGLEELTVDRGLFEPGSTPVKVLYRYLDRHPELLGVKAYDPEGRSIALAVQSWTPPAMMEAFRGLAPPSQEDQGGFQVGDPVGVTGTRVLFLPVSLPLGRNQAGWLTGALDLRALLAEVRDLRFSGSGHTWAADRLGRTVLHWELDRAFEQEDRSQTELFRAAEAGWKGGLMAYRTPAREEPIPMVGRYRRLDETGWTLMTALPEADLGFPLRKPETYMEHIRQELRSSLRWAGLVVLLWLAAFWRHVRRTVARPLAWLTRGLDTCAGGDFDVFIPPRRQDEVGRVIEAFDRMSQATVQVIVPPHERSPEESSESEEGS